MSNPKSEPKKELSAILKIANFHKKYCPQIVNWGHKWIGYNTNRNAKDFTEADKKIIRAGIKRMQADINKITKTIS